MKKYACPLLIVIFLANLICADAVQAAGRRTFAVLSPEAARLISKEQAPQEAELIIKEAEGYLHGPIKAQAKLHYEGMLDINDLFIARDWDKMLCLALAYRLSKDERYMKRLRVYFVQWLDVFNLSKGPILSTNDCLGKRPVPDPGAHCLDPIDDSRLDSLILAYDLSQDGLNQALRMKMIQFMHNVAESYVHEIVLLKASNDNTIKEDQRTNWQSQRIKLATLSAYLSGDRKLVAEARKAFKMFIYTNMIYASRATGADGKRKTVFVNDGSTYDFYKRDALHYAVYDLEALLISAAAAEAHGDHWYAHASSKGSSLSKAMQWLVPYATGKMTHQEFASSKTTFDIQRRRAAWKGFYGDWDPKRSKTIFRMAVKLDKSFDTKEIGSFIDGSYPQSFYNSKLEVQSDDPGEALRGFLFRIKSQ